MATRYLFLTLLLSTAAARADDWPQWLGPQRDGIWRETGIIQAFPEAGLNVKWRVPVAAGYSGPSVAGGRVYLTDRQQGKAGSANPFQRGVIPGNERVLCFEEKTGKVLWQYDYDCPYNLSYPAGPRATPLVHEGKVYTLGAEGHLLCLNTVDGKVIWSRELKKDYAVETPVWGFAAHPLIDGEKLICLVGGSNSVAVAFHKDNGKELWRALSAKEPGYCPPMIYTVGKTRQLIVWHPESINSLDPETGKVFWSQPFPVRSGLSIPTPRLHDDLLFITSFYNGPIMLRLDRDKPAASVVWRGKKTSERDTDGLHSIMPTPYFDGDYIYGLCSYGQLRGLKAATGERLWETFAATTGGKEVRWANAFLIRNGDRFFLPNEKGELIIARLTPKGYEEISRAKMLDPTNTAAGREVVWSHPAFANRCIYARNDKELICASLAE
jgi:outer membrane protein assembly factor BamB